MFIFFNDTNNIILYEFFIFFNNTNNINGIIGIVKKLA